MIVVALFVAVILLLEEKTKEFTPDHKIVFVLDINRTMNTEDVLSGTLFLSRLDAAKYVIQNTLLSYPGFSYWLILFNAGTDYLLPPTFDTGTFLLYLSGITTNLLPDGIKNFSSLTGLLNDDYTTYILFSDFDTVVPADFSLPRWTSAIGLGSPDGDIVRYANGIRYYNNGNPVYSARDDVVGKSLNVPYTAVSDLNDFAVDALLFRGISLPLSQRIFLYMLLGVLVILTVMI